jgi:cytochrome P450/pimeloyl-ACP methyl ester carboxylesterase
MVGAEAAMTSEMLTAAAQTEQLIDVGRGVQLCARTAGDRGDPALVLIAGLGQQLNVWPRELVDGLVDRGYFVVRLDNRDIGRSTRSPSPVPSPTQMLHKRFAPSQYTLADMADDTAGLLDGLGIEHAHLVGMSLGGMIAQTVAARHPHRVLSLTSIMSTTGARRIGRPAASTWLRMAKPPVSDREATVARMVAMMRHVGSRGYPFEESAVRAVALEAWDRAGGPQSDGVVRQLAAAFKSGDRTAEMARIGAPTLVIHGDRDPMIHPSGGAATARAITGARLRTMPGMGHDLPHGAVWQLVEDIASHADRAAETPAELSAQEELRLPPGPRTPKLLNGLVFLAARNSMIRHLQRRYGDVFRLDMPGFGRMVLVTRPDLVKQVYTAKPDVLHGGKNPLGEILGPGSLFSMDEERHLEERRMLLPPFHGDRMRSYEALIEEEALRAMASWHDGEEFASIETFKAITLRIILRAVFGAEGRELAELQQLIPPLTAVAQRLVTAPILRRDVGRWSPGGRYRRLLGRYREIVVRLIDGHLTDPALVQRIDILALMLRAQRDGGETLDYDALGDELLTLLAAGHETTASALAWSVERLRRHPEVLRRLEQEARGADATLRIATINEVLRVRPVISITGRLAMKPFALDGWLLPPGTRVLTAITSVHEDDRFHDEARRFDPDRYVDRKPDTYAWIPFGGGLRRCLGAAFAQFEMDVVLRTLLRNFALQPTSEPPERESFRGVAFAPAKGGRALIRRRQLELAGDASEPASEETRSAGNGAAGQCPVDRGPLERVSGQRDSEAARP